MLDVGPIFSISVDIRETVGVGLLIKEISENGILKRLILVEEGGGSCIWRHVRKRCKVGYKRLEKQVKFGQFLEL